MIKTGRLMDEFQCDAILFDLDGVLVDSTQVVERQWRLWAIRHQVDLAQLMAIAHGRRAIEIIQMVAPHLNSQVEAAGLAAAEAADTDGLRVYEGAHRLLTTLPVTAHAIATSGTHAVASTRLAFAGLPTPAVFVTSDDVQRGKPNPDPYLLAAARLGIPAERCVVFEDAPAGIEAGLAAGARVIAVASTHPKAELSRATAIVERLADVQLTIHHGNGYKLTVRLPTAG